jgi:hypothetical protein
MSDMRLGKNIDTKKQLDEFAAFQDSQGTRRAYLAETAELAYNGRNACKKLDHMCVGMWDQGGGSREMSGEVGASGLKNG